MIKNKLQILNYIVIIITLTLFFILVFNPNMDVSFLTAIVTFILLSLFTFVCGIKINKKEVYENNIIIYMILYFIFLFSLTMLIGRFGKTLINMKYFQMYLRDINIIPFKTIIKYLTSKVSLQVMIYNIVGNFIALMPLSLLLMLKNDKNRKLSKQFIKISIIVLIIEILQLVFSCGKFDIDDFILNVSGALAFSYILLKTNTLSKIKRIFVTDMKLKSWVKKILLLIVILIIIMFNILLISDLIAIR